MIQGFLNKNSECLICISKAVLLLLVLFPWFGLGAVSSIVAVLLFVGSFILFYFLRRKNKLIVPTIIGAVLLVIVLVVSVVVFFTTENEDSTLYYSYLISVLFYILLDMAINNLRFPKKSLENSLKSNLFFFCIKMLLALLLCIPVSFLILAEYRLENKILVWGYLIYLSFNGLFFILFKKKRLLDKIVITLLNLIDISTIIITIVSFVRLLKLMSDNIGEAGFGFVLFPIYYGMLFYGFLALILNNSSIGNFKRREIKTAEENKG